MAKSPRTPPGPITPDEGNLGQVRAFFAAPVGVTINGDRYTFAAGEHSVPRFVLPALTHSNQTYELL